jgi:hypothetical protein
MSKSKELPRFVLMLQDTKHEVDGLRGKQFYSIQVAFDSKEQLLRAETKLDGSSELLHLVDVFFENVEQLDSTLVMKPKKEIS